MLLLKTFLNLLVFLFEYIVQITDLQPVIQLRIAFFRLFH